MRRLKAAPNRLQGVPERATVSSLSWRAGKESSAARGYGHRWRCYRENYLRQHPLCVMCMADGVTSAASVVDHMVPHRGNEELFWDQRNHQALCKSCHDGRKARLEHESGQRTT